MLRFFIDFAHQTHHFLTEQETTLNIIKQTTSQDLCALWTHRGSISKTVGRSLVRDSKNATLTHKLLIFLAVFLQA